MEQKDKELLLKDLCARLPYNPLVYVDARLPRLKIGASTRIWEYIAVDDPCKPYLRPMSSMTKEEWEQCNKETGFLFGAGADSTSFNVYDYVVIDEGGRIELNIEKMNKLASWLYKNHFDVNHLIKKGLALEAPKGMYDIKVE